MVLPKTFIYRGLVILHKQRITRERFIIIRILDRQFITLDTLSGEKTASNCQFFKRAKE